MPAMPKTQTLRLYQSLTMNRTYYYSNYYQTHQESLKAKRRERYARLKTVEQKKVEQPLLSPLEQLPRL
jgi:hypothetical protein